MPLTGDIEVTAMSVRPNRGPFEISVVEWDRVVDYNTFIPAPLTLHTLDHKVLLTDACQKGDRNFSIFRADQQFRRPVLIACGCAVAHRFRRTANVP